MTVVPKESRAAAMRRGDGLTLALVTACSGEGAVEDDGAFAAVR